MPGPPHVPHTPRGASAAGHVADAELHALSLDLVQLALDLAGIVEPTPFSDGASALISLGRGDWLGAVLSGASMVPYVGDLAKAGKFPKYLKTLERAVVLAQKSEHAAALLRPVMQRLDQTLNLFPKHGGHALEEMRRLVGGFLRENRVARAVEHRLPDISKRFRFHSFEKGEYLYKEASGALGVPGRVVTHRSKTAQHAVSHGLGEDAGHLIGNRFGAPGGVENLSPQHWVMNRGGTFKELENHWAHQLEHGTGIEVMVQDVFRKGEGRPFMRKVHWTEINPHGGRTQHELLFSNPHSPKSRAAQGVGPTVSHPQHNNVIHADFANKRRP